MTPRMQIGGCYNWKNQAERLVYLGKNWSGNGYWHQFALTSRPMDVWCEVLDDDLERFEETRQIPSCVPPVPKLSPRQARRARKAEKRAAAQKGGA